MANKTGFGTIIVILFITILIIVFVLSLGKVNTIEVSPVKAFNAEKEEAQRKFKQFQKILRSQKKLKKELDKKFKRIYFSVRIIVLILWALIISAFYYFGWATSILEIVGIASLPLWFVKMANYLASGTSLNLEDFIKITEMKTKNWIYGEYINLDQIIEERETQLIQLEKEKQ